MARRRLHIDWPLKLIFWGFPVWWALGLGVLIWPLLAVVMGAQLALRRGIRLPRGFGIWLLFLIWVGASFIGLSAGHLPIASIFRLTTYLSVTVVFVWMYNADPEDVPTRTVVAALAGFWLITVAGGWLGVLVPRGAFTSPLERLLPPQLASQAFLQEIIHPSFAQVQTFLGYPLGRPKAPFPYTNDWGAVYALAAPFFFYGWLQAPDAGRRRRALLLLGASFVPVFVSLNRGLWLGLGAALVNASTRSGDAARSARRVVLAMVVLIIILLVSTPLSSVVEQRAATGHSNQGRAYLYGEAVKAVNRSPLIGFGGTIKTTTDRLLPPIGTQGHFWTVMVGQGYVGLFLYEAFLVRMWFATRRRLPDVTFWAHATLTVMLVVQFVYDFGPVQLNIAFIAIALALRDAHRLEDDEKRARLARASEAPPSPSLTATSPMTVAGRGRLPALRSSVAR